MRAPKLFPNHFQLILNETDRMALEALYEQDDHLVNGLELIHKVIRAGIRAMQKEGKKVQRSETAFSAPNVPEIEPIFAQSKRPVTKPPTVANYVELPLVEARLRCRIVDLVASYPGVISDEEATAMLIDLDAATPPLGRVKRLG